MRVALHEKVFLYLTFHSFPRAPLPQALDPLFFRWFLGWGVFWKQASFSSPPSLFAPEPSNLPRRLHPHALPHTPPLRCGLTHVAFACSICVAFLFACRIHFPSVHAPFSFISMAAQVTRGRSQSIPYHRICGFGSRRTTIAMGLQTYNREIAGFTPVASSALQPSRAGTYCLLPTTHYFPASPLSGHIHLRPPFYFQPTYLPPSSPTPNSPTFGFLLQQPFASLSAGRHDICGEATHCQFRTSLLRKAQYPH